MTYYKKNLSEPWFSLILDGLKTIEGRLNKGAFSYMNIGDIITWYNMENWEYREFKTVIMNIKNYNNFYDLIKSEKLINTLPYVSIKTIDQGVNDVYYNYYKKEDEKKYGVISFKLRVI